MPDSKYYYVNKCHFKNVYRHQKTGEKALIPPSLCSAVNFVDKEWTEIRE